jgi:hypothetical protein
MALTFTRTGYNPLGSTRPIRGGFGADIVMTMGEFTFGATTYVTGGVALAAADVGLNDILFIIFTPEPSAGASAKGQSFNAQYDYTNGKVMTFGTSALATGTMISELSHGTDLSAFTVRFVAFGHSLT